LFTNLEENCFCIDISVTSSEDSISDFDDNDMGYSQNSCNSIHGITSSSCSVPGVQNGNGTVTTTKFPPLSKDDDSESSDSDSPLRDVPVYKGIFSKSMYIHAF
jgi:hypothetical protein